MTLDDILSHRAADFAHAAPWQPEPTFVASVCAAGDYPADATLRYDPIAPDGSPWVLSGPAPMHLLTCSACGEMWRSHRGPADA
jgi:hypothetical protein